LRATIYDGDADVNGQVCVGVMHKALRAEHVSRKTTRHIRREFAGCEQDIPQQGQLIVSHDLVGAERIVHAIHAGV
jgi:hypothetical protein